MSSKKILVVDDDADQLRLIRTYLEEAGYEVEAARDGQEAVEKAKSLKPLLITLDILMPRMNGLQVIETLRQDPETVDIPIIVVSVTEKVDLVTGSSPQVVDYLTKPIDFDALLESIGKALACAPPPLPAPSAGRTKILVVDDDPEVLELLSIFLESRGYVPVTVSEGDKVLGVVEKENPQIILLDIMLPGIHGLSLIEQLKKNPVTAQVPIIVLTAIKLNAFQEQGLLTGTQEFVARSVPREFLLREIEKKLREIEQARPEASARKKEPKLRILVADDELDLLNLMREALEQADFEVWMATDGREALDMVFKNSPDLLILDLKMPRIDGFEVCQTLKRDPMYSHIPVVILTAAGETESKVRGLNLGADDYVTKPVNLEELLARVRMIIRRNRQELEANPLTRLPGNIAIEAHLDRCIRDHLSFAVLSLDLNQFKSYNDAYGFDRGDRVIKAMGEILLEMSRQLSGGEDFVGHIGGDDFIVVSHPSRSEAWCRGVLERFEKLVPAFYDEEDRKRGHIISTDRQGRVEKFPLLSVAVGVVTNQQRRLISVGQISQIGAELKAFIKRQGGNRWAVDRRKDPGYVPPQEPPSGEEGR